MEISKEVYRIKDRDIIKVTLPDGTVQPFYKSSGRNSGMKDTWLPFDGIKSIYGQPVWFDKSRFLVKLGAQIDRFGNMVWVGISQNLAQLNITQGEEKTADEINEWLGYEGELMT